MDTSGSAGAPVVAGAVAGRPLLRDLARRLGPPDPPLAWRKIHIVASLAMTIVLGASGGVLWIGVDLPPSVLDGALEAHVAATWLLAVSIPVHLAIAWRKLVARTGEILGLAPDSRLDPSLFDDED
jgi:hypothetical protein